MPSWLLKASVQRAISLLPASRFWNRLFQTYITKSLTLSDDFFLSRVEAARSHLERFQLHTEPFRDGIRVVELGTGYFPIVPIALWLCGAEKIQTYDISELLVSDRLAATLDKFVAMNSTGSLIDRLPHANTDRLNQLASIALNARKVRPKELLKQIGIEYLVQDFKTTTTPDSSVDLIISYAVLEYPDRENIIGMLRICKRILRIGGVMSHWIDLRDEYAYFDNTITPYNFLRFSDRGWDIINNSLIPLNRLRLSDFCQALRLAGFRIVDETTELGEEQELARVPVAEKFRDYPKEDLLALETWLVCVV